MSPQLDELVTHRRPLAEVDEGFAAMAKGEAVRAVLGFDSMVSSAASSDRRRTE